MHKRLWIPGPVEVHPEVLQACSVPMIAHRGKDYQKIHSGVKAKLRTLLGTDKGQVYLFTSSSTGAMEAALLGLQLRIVRLLDPGWPFLLLV